MVTTKLLLTGASGYVGGSVLTKLLSATNPIIENLEITAMVRRPEHAQFLAQLGVKTVLFAGLGDTVAVERVAGEHDIVINTACSYHPRSAKTIVDGLAERHKRTGKSVHLIHTSGTSNLGDRPITKVYKETRVFSDKQDIYGYLRHRGANEKYPQPPTIYGIGSGLFNRSSIQIDTIMRCAKRQGFTSVIGTSEGQWDHIHVEDVADHYKIILARVLNGDELLSNKKGVYFAETGHHTWREVSENIAKTGKDAGFLSSGFIKEETLDDAAKAIEKDLDVAELGFVSHSRTTADLSRKIGWAPKMSREDFLGSFVKEWEVIGNEF